jgi:hypothetical protein
MKAIAAVCSLVAVFALAGCAWERNLTDRRSLEGAFTDEFHFTPSESVADLHCKMVGIGDTYAKWMAFRCDDDTFRQIVGDGFERARGAELRSSGGLWREDLTQKGVNAPDWWRTPSDLEHLTVYYKTSHPADVSGYIFIWVDERSKIVYAKVSAWH